MAKVPVERFVNRVLAITCLLLLIPTVSATSLDIKAENHQQDHEHDGLCSDPDFNGTLLMPITGGEETTLIICFTNPSDDFDRFDLEYALSEDYLLSVGVSSVEVDPNQSAQVTFLIVAPNEYRTDDLVITISARGNTTMTDEITISLQVTEDEQRIIPALGIFSAAGVIALAAVFQRVRNLIR